MLNNGFEDKSQIGVIAQEIEKIIPELVNTDNKWYKTVKYDKLSAILVEAIKELKAEKDNEIAELKAKNDSLQELICLDHPTAEICQ